jgi:Spy/CpxP family protein refolding chaperone
MSKKRIEVLLISVTALALCAGLAAGLLASRLPGGAQPPPAPAPTESAEPRTPLVEELNLTAEQREQMRQIWEGVRGQVRQAFEDAQRLQKQRDEALVSLLTDEQKAKFEKISKDYAGRFDELTHKRDATFQNAVERTRRILNDEQRQKYDQILKRQVGSAAAPTTAMSSPARSSPARKLEARPCRTKNLDADRSVDLGIKPPPRRSTFGSSAPEDEHATSQPRRRTRDLNWAAQRDRADGAAHLPVGIADAARRLA